MSSKISAIKFSLGDDKRRVNLDEHPDLDFGRLCAIITRAFGNHALDHGFTLQYLDDEDDFITVASDGGLVEAMRIASLLGRASLQLVVRPLMQDNDALEQDNDALESASQLADQQYLGDAAEDNQELVVDQPFSSDSTPDGNSVLSSEDEFCLVETMSNFSGAVGREAFDEQQLVDQESLSGGSDASAQEANVEEDARSELSDGEHVSVPKDDEVVVDEPAMTEPAIDEPAIDEPAIDEPPLPDDQDAKLEVDDQHIVVEEPVQEEAQAVDEPAGDEAVDEPSGDEAVDEPTEDPVDQVVDERVDPVPLLLKHVPLKQVATPAQTTDAQPDDDAQTSSPQDPIEFPENDWTVDSETSSELSQPLLGSSTDAKLPIVISDRISVIKDIESGEEVVEEIIPLEAEPDVDIELGHPVPKPDDKDDMLDEVAEQLLSVALEDSIADAELSKMATSDSAKSLDALESNAKEREEEEDTPQVNTDGGSDEPPRSFQWEPLINLVSTLHATATDGPTDDTARDIAKSVACLLTSVKEVASDSARQAHSAAREAVDNLKKERGIPASESLWECLPALLVNEEVVRTIQEGLSDPAVTKLVVELCKIRNGEGAAKLPSMYVKRVLAHLDKLLVLVGKMVKKAPELLACVPPFIMMVSEYLKSNMAADDDHSASSQEATAPSKTVVHEAYCDGCLKHEDLKTAALQQECIERDSNLICGIRYKSAVLEDFDVCAACEESGRFEDEAAPFLKIRTPKKKPSGIFCVLKEDHPSRVVPPKPTAAAATAARNSDIDLDWRQTMGQFRAMAEAKQIYAQRTSCNQGRGRCNARPKTRKCDTAKASPACESTDPTCPAKHRLSGFHTPHSFFTCDKCESQMRPHVAMFGCRDCDYDLCSMCYNRERLARPSDPEKNGKSHNNGKAAGRSKVAPATPATPTPPTKPVAPPKPQARFISDVTLQDGSVVRPGQKLVKTWRVQNSGKQKWPEGCRVVCVGGDRMEGPFAGKLLAPLEQGEVTDISVELYAPSRSGRYVGYWRFITADNERFGHRFWVDLSVASSLTDQITAAAAQPVRQALNHASSLLGPKDNIPVASSASVPAAVKVSQPSTPEAVVPTAQEPAVPMASPAPAAAPSAPTAQDEASGKFVSYSDELTQLANMGFCDLERNLDLLKQENGDVNAVISLLLERGGN